MKNLKYVSLFFLFLSSTVGFCCLTMPGIMNYFLAALNFFAAYTNYLAYSNFKETNADN